MWKCSYWISCSSSVHLNQKKRKEASTGSLRLTVTPRFAQMLKSYRTSLLVECVLVDALVVVAADIRTHLSSLSSVLRPPMSWRPIILLSSFA